jgi:hypothetical protein
MSNAGGMATIQRYTDMLAGNTTWSPWEPDGAYDALATVTVPSGGLASIVFAGIPNTYKHLQIRYLSRSTRSGSSTDSMSIRFNGDTGSNYARHYLYGDGSSASAGASTSQTSSNIGTQSAASASANIFGVGIVDIFDYTSTTINKTIRCLSGVDFNGAGETQLSSGLYFATPVAVNSITFLAQSGSANFTEYSQFSLFGVK